MAEIQSERVNLSEYYMPHHSVIKEDSRTTKTRVVFDVSARTTSGLSLNDFQMTGPVVQSELLSILLRFRIHSFVISADISKMYRQILIAPDQRHLQRILWRENSCDPIKIFELNTVTYGITRFIFSNQMFSAVS